MVEELAQAFLSGRQGLASGLMVAAGQLPLLSPNATSLESIPQWEC